MRSNGFRTGLFACFIFLIFPSAGAVATSEKSEMALVPAGQYPSFEKPRKTTTTKDSSGARIKVELTSFWLDRRPVSNEDFLKFVRLNPEWRRGQAKSIFVDSQYLIAWPSTLRFARKSAKQPVTQVSWFAAKAYCESKGKSLPTTDEWEYALFDQGRNQKAVREKILTWYAETAASGLKNVGTSPTNGFGISDLGLLVWEWTDDFDSFLSASDSRDGGKDAKLFCGGGSEIGDSSDYASFMRYSFRSSLKANDTTSSLGFRCAKDAL
jgi:sulfatase modifying factor 1